MTVIQHADRNVSPAEYKLLKGSLLVTKIFYTIQGEGPFAGHPAIFVRLAGCNRGVKEGMGCEFCDTAFQFGKGVIMTYEEIISEMLAVMPNLTRPMVVITGGEPMIQNNLTEFVRGLNDNRWRVQIESNGDRLADGWGYYIAMLVVSPKVGRRGYRALAAEVYLAAHALKFVISADPSSFYYNVPDYAHEFNGRDEHEVYLSPLTVYKQAHDPTKPVSAWDPELVDHEATERNYWRAKNLALQYGFKTSMQQHLFFGVE